MLPPFIVRSTPDAQITLATKNMPNQTVASETLPALYPSCPPPMKEIYDQLQHASSTTLQSSRLTPHGSVRPVVPHYLTGEKVELCHSSCTCPHAGCCTSLPPTSVRVSSPRETTSPLLYFVERGCPVTRVVGRFAKPVCPVHPNGPNCSRPSNGHVTENPMSQHHMEYVSGPSRSDAYTRPNSQDNMQRPEEHRTLVNMNHGLEDPSRPRTEVASTFGGTRPIAETTYYLDPLGQKVIGHSTKHYNNGESVSGVTDCQGNISRITHDYSGTQNYSVPVEAPLSTMHYDAAQVRKSRGVCC